MDLEQVVKLVDKAVSHSYLNNKTFISTVFLKVPIVGWDAPHLLRIERRIYIDDARHLRNEEEGVAHVLAKEVKYIVDSADQYEQPVHMMDDDGSLRVVGMNVIRIDRRQIRYPKLLMDTSRGECVVLDCFWGEE